VDEPAWTVAPATAWPNWLRTVRRSVWRRPARSVRGSPMIRIPRPTCATTRRPPNVSERGAPRPVSATVPFALAREANVKTDGCAAPGPESTIVTFPVPVPVSSRP
jgi:hypothetical protein